MTFDTDTKKALIAAVAEAVIERAEELTALDSAIGDGDHGFNMKRGMEAVLAEQEAIAEQPLPDALKAIGMQLVMKVGGASGPLYGTFFLGLSKALSGIARSDDPTRDEAVAAFAAAIDAVKARGKSDAGQKTMLDVLVPVHTAWANGADGKAIAEAAEAAKEATKPMKAERGRASFLGERSVGHVDPGARSSQIMIAAFVSAFGGVQ